jgi:hypothetical protein
LRLASRHPEGPFSSHCPLALTDSDHHRARSTGTWEYPELVAQGRAMPRECEDWQVERGRADG